MRINDVWLDLNPSLLYFKVSKEENFIYACDLIWTFLILISYSHSSLFFPSFFSQIDFLSLSSRVGFVFHERKQRILGWNPGILNSNVDSEISSFMDISSHNSWQYNLKVYLPCDPAISLLNINTKGFKSTYQECAFIITT